MSVLKKLGAVALGAAAGTGWLITQGVKEAFNAAADKGGTSKYSAEEYREKAKGCDAGSKTCADYFNKAKDLWQDED